MTALACVPSHVLFFRPTSEWTLEVIVALHLCKRIPCADTQIRSTSTSSTDTRPKAKGQWLAVVTRSGQHMLCFPRWQQTLPKQLETD
eukprot:5344567-Amphidinium_carterae.2